MRVQVDYDRCTGLGVCESLAPEVFAVQDDGRMRVLNDRPGDTLRERLAEAAASCPTQAITIADEA
jgi:ferredoxin